MVSELTHIFAYLVISASSDFSEATSQVEISYSQPNRNHILVFFSIAILFFRIT